MAITAYEYLKSQHIWSLDTLRYMICFDCKTELTPKVLVSTDRNITLLALPQHQHSSKFVTLVVVIHVPTSLFILSTLPICSVRCIFSGPSSRIPPRLLGFTTTYSPDGSNLAI